MGMMRWTPEGVGERIVEIALSISAQSAARYDEKTVLASYSGVSAAFAGLGQIADAVSQAERDVAAMPGYPGEYLRGMLRAHACTLRVMQGDDVPYGERLAAMQQLTFRPLPEGMRKTLEERLDKSLTDKGYRGALGEKILAYLKDTRISPEQVTAVAGNLIADMRRDTLERVSDLPEDEAVSEICGTTGVFWSGYSKYDGKNKGTVTFNLERPWSLPTFANVLAHEAYPGHQTFYCLWDALFLSGRFPLEAAYYAYNTPTNTLFEGGPENGLDFLGWLDEEETPALDSALREGCRLGRDILDLQRFVQTQACYLYHMEGAGADEAAAYMMETGLFREIEAQNVVRFFTHPVQCTYYPTYYYGRHMIAQAFRLYGRANRREFFRTLYTQPHTNDTLIAAVSAAAGTAFRPFDHI